MTDKQHESIFSILDRVDSTNNYAMGMVHAGLAKPGMAWFAKDQTAGKGQRTKAWISEPGSNIIMSIALHAGGRQVSESSLFQLQASLSVCCIRFLRDHFTGDFKIKWPNDIYWRDRKAGGLLVENIIRGNKWLWSIAGIGINVNQTEFPADIRATSIRTISGKMFDPVLLARQLHLRVLSCFENEPAGLMNDYNNLLFKKNEQVKIRYESNIYEVEIKKVDETGKLHVQRSTVGPFSFGEIEWIIP